MSSEEGLHCLRSLATTTAMGRLASFFLVVSLGLSACGAATQSARADVGFRSYIKALRGDDPRPVYDMLTREQREAMSYADWAALWEESQAERGLQAKELEASLQTHGLVEERAQMSFVDGKVVTLRRNDQGWRLDQALVARSRADSPHDALNVFSAALSDRSLGGLLQILSKDRRAALEERLASLQASLASQLEEGWRDLYFLSPERAELVWSYQGVRYKVVLIKQEGDWLIDDLHLGPDPLVDDTVPGEGEAPPPPPFLPR